MKQAAEQESGLATKRRVESGCSSSCCRMTDGAHAVIRSCLSCATKATLAALIANVALIPPLFTQASASVTGMREALQRFLIQKKIFLSNAKKQCICLMKKH